MQPQSLPESLTVPEFVVAPPTRTPVPLRVQRLTDLAECQPYLAAWNDLAADVPFRRWEWLTTWWKHYGASHELYVLLVIDDEGVVRGIAPWYLDVDGGRTVRFLGDGKVCTDYVTILCREHDRRSIVRAIGEWLIAADLPGGSDAWDALELDGVLADDPAMDMLLGVLRHHQLSITERRTASCYRASLPATVADYIQSRAKTNRLTMRRIQRNLAAGAIRCRHLFLGDTLSDEDWNLFVDLHELRRRTLNEQGCFQHPPFGEFLREATTLLMPLGMSSILYVYDGETPMAAVHLLHNEHVTYVYQTGMDPGVREKRPGYVCFAMAIWWTIERGARAFDLMRGDEPYKQGWRAEPQRARNIRVSSRHLRARLRHQWLAGRSALKEWLTVGFKSTATP